METRVCSWCNQTVPKEDYCVHCTEEIQTRRAPETMTAEERQAEFDGMMRCEVPFPMMHKRVEALIGRPVWTHEFADSARLREQMQWKARPATMEEIINLIPEEKRIIIS